MLCLSAIMVALLGCRTRQSVQQNTLIQEVPTQAVQSIMPPMMPVDVVIESTAMKKMVGGFRDMTINKESRCVIVEEDADMVFPADLGGFSLSYIGRPDIGGFSDKGKTKRPICICYDSGELKSSACVLIETIPLGATGEQMDLDACWNRMREMVSQFAMGRPPQALYDQENESRIISSFQHVGDMDVIHGVHIDKISQDGRQDVLSLPCRRLSWSWRIANRRASQYLIDDKDFHGAEMFWFMRRGHSQVGFSHILGNDAPPGEVKYSLSSLVIPRNGCLITVIVQTEGEEASANHPKAEQTFTAFFDKDVLSSSCHGFYYGQAEKYERSGWSMLDKRPLSLRAALKKDVPQDVLSACLSKAEMEGKTFEEICGSDDDLKLNYSKNDAQSRLADAFQHLLLHIKEYATKIPPRHRKPFEIVFKGANGYVDADALLCVLNNNAMHSNQQDEALSMQETVLREKIMLRLRQVRHITRIIANGRHRRQKALEREVDTKRTAILEAYIQRCEADFARANVVKTRDQIREDIRHVFSELKSGRVSTRLNDNGSLQGILFRMGERTGIDPTLIQIELAKTFFDLGDDILALRTLNMRYSENIVSREDILAYMMSNGLGISIYENAVSLPGGLGSLTGWTSPYLAHLMILSNEPIHKFVLGDLMSEGKTGIVRELLLADVPVNTRHRGQQLPLSIAIRRGDAELEQLLLVHGADKELHDADGKSPEDHRIYGRYWKALNSRDYKTQKECLEKGMEINQPLPALSSKYLYVAFNNRDVEAVRLLLEAGAKLPGNLLFDSYRTGQIEIFKLLLKHGCPLEWGGMHILDSLLRAEFFGPGARKVNSIDFLKALLAEMDKERLNEEILIFDRIKITPACCAIYAGDLQKLKLLEEAGADITRLPTSCSLSPLFFAVFKGGTDIGIYMHLLSKGIDVNNVRVPKCALLHNAFDIVGMSSEIATMGVEKTGLLTYLARVDATSRYSFRREAFLRNLLMYLAEKGAKPDIKDSYGKTTLDYIEEMKNRKSSAADLWKNFLQDAGLVK